MNVKENKMYCATFPENGGSVSAVFEDGSSKLICSSDKAEQKNFLAIREEITTTEGVEIDPFAEAPAVALSWGSGEGENVTINSEGSLVVDLSNASSYPAKAIIMKTASGEGAIKVGGSGSITISSLYVDGSVTSSGKFTSRGSADFLGDASFSGEMMLQESPVVNEEMLNSRIGSLSIDNNGYLCFYSSSNYKGFYISTGGYATFNGRVWTQELVGDRKTTLSGTTKISGVATFNGNGLDAFPIGTKIESLAENISGWLPCDGSTFDNVDYPELASLLAEVAPSMVTDTTFTLPSTGDTTPFKTFIKALVPDSAEAAVLGEDEFLDDPYARPETIEES